MSDSFGASKGLATNKWKCGEDGEEAQEALDFPQMRDAAMTRQGW